MKLIERKRNILLITSTIMPAAGATFLKITDPVSRLEEYCTAFHAYLGLLDKGVIDHIVYADNSGFPLDDLMALADRCGHADRVEFLSFKAQGDPAAGRYYLEMELIETALQISQVISINKDDTIWKVTGRYIVSNISSIVSNAPCTFDIYVNCRNYPIQFLDFFLVGFCSRTFPHILGREMDLYKSETLSGEVILRNRIDAGVFKEFNIVPRFRETPKLVAGRRGYDGASYASWREVVKYKVRCATRVLMPWIWL